jgi:hypothetical protein
MKEIIRKAGEMPFYYKYSWYDLKLDLLSNISWSSYNYLRKYRFNDSYDGDITIPYYSDYPMKRNRMGGHPYSRVNYSFNFVVVGMRI